MTYSHNLSGETCTEQKKLKVLHVLLYVRWNFQAQSLVYKITDNNSFQIVFQTSAKLSTDFSKNVCGRLACVRRSLL